MKQKLLNNFKLRATLLVAMLCAAFTGAWAAEEVYKTAFFGSSYNSESIGSYTATWTATNNGFTVSLANFNNNKNAWAYVKCGRKNTTSVATITTSEAIDQAISKVVVTIDAITANNVNSIKLYTSSDNSTWTEAGSFTKATGAKEVTLASPAANLYYKIEFDCASGSANGLVTVSKVEYYYNPGGAASPSISADDIAIEYNATSGTIEYTINNGVDGGILSATTEAEWLTPGIVGATVPFSCEANENGERTATVTLTYTYDNESVTKNVIVTQAANPNGPGSENNPYNVAQARAAIDASTGTTGVYATGVISQVDSYNSNYNSITYWISEDGTTTSDQLEVYSGKGLNNTNFTSVNDVVVGATVVVYGTLKKYGDVYEFDKNNYLTSYSAPAVAVEAPTFSPIAGTYADAQNVTISCETAGATIYYTTDGTEPTNQSLEYTSAIAVNADMTIKAIAYDVTGANSTVATATYHICSADNPYTVTQALAFSEYPANGVYVSGIVSTAPTQSPTNNGQLTYYISVNGEATNQLQVYKGLGLNEAAFTAQDDIQVGDEVTIYGNVKIYNNTKEFDTGNYLVAFNRPATPTITVTSTSLTGFTYLVDNGPSAAQQITIGGENLTNSWSAYLDDYGNSNFEFSFTEDGEYFSDSGVGSMPEPNQNVLIYVRLKSGLAVGDYTGAITITSQGAETVTVNLSGSVAAALEAPVWSELPTETISVGEDYVLNLADYVSGSPVPAISIETGGDIAQFEDNILYFTPTEAGSFDFTFNATNSVGSVNAILTVTVSAPASIEPSETAINIPAATTTGYETIEVTYKNFTNQPTAHERFYDDDDNILTSNPATWIIVGTSDNNIFYQVKEENTSSEPRSVHFRIWAYDDNQQGVSSELITITQAGVPVPVTDDSYQLYTGALTEGDYIIYYDGKAMNTTVSSDRLQYAEVTPENDVITTSDASIVWHIAQSGEYWTIYNVEANAYAAGTGAKNKAQMLDDGTDDKALWTVSGTETYEFVNKANAAANVNANLRNNGTYGFACYATGTGGALSLYKKVTNITPSITITPDTYEMDAKAGGGELPVVCANLATDPQLAVVFVEADGETPATYDWITAEINNNGNIDGQILANETGEARTAYFVVRGVDADNNYVYSNLVTFTQEAAPTEPFITVNTGSWDFDVNGGSKTFGFDFANLGDNPTFEVAFFDQTGETEIECGWISYEFVGDKVTITASNNDENSARTAYFKVYAEVNKTKIYSNLVTINQAAPVVDYAELPFYWGGGASANLAALNGVTLYGNGTDYGNSHDPYLVKLDSDNDYILLKTNSQPGVVTVGVKMIGGGNTSTITVQESADGETFTDVQELTISGKQNDVLDLATTNVFAENSRYVRLLFTKGSNVGVGPISISKASTEPSITITPDTYEMDAKAGGGELPVVCANLATDPQLEVVFVEADGETPATYDWITAEINNNGNIDGQILANETGEARTAYFVVRGVDADNNVVKSNLVTFTQQAAPTEPFITVNTGSWVFDLNGGSKTFGFDFANLGDNPTFEVAFFDQTGETEIECGWISYEFVGDKVTISAMTNDEGAARTAYFKVYAEVNKTKIYSNLVTINQAAPAITYSLATSITPGKHYLIVGNNGGNYQAMGEQKANNRTAINVIMSAGKISITDEEVKEVVIYGPDASGFYTIYEDGCLYAAASGSNNMKTQATNNVNGKWEITFDKDAAASIAATESSNRNVMQFNSGSSLFSCYASASQSPIYLYEKDEDTPAATTESVTLNAYGYATFATTSALDFLDAEDADYSAWRISEINGSAITFEQLTQHVAAGQGVFIKGTANATVDLNILPAGGATLGTENLLVAITEATPVTAGEYCGLKGNEFVLVNAGTVPAGKALLPAPDPTSGVKAYTFIFNDADGIQTVQTVSAEEAQTIFNLAGQRLPKAQKGINIINGKKVLVK